MFCPIPFCLCIFVSLIAFLRFAVSAVLTVFSLVVFRLFVIAFPVSWYISITQVAYIYFLIDTISCAIPSHYLKVFFNNIILYIIFLEKLR